MPLYDFECTTCGEVVEEVVSFDTKKIDCEVCEGDMKRLACSGTTLTNIIPSYKGCLKQKAGYMHTHADKPATKIMSGPAGCTSPK